MHILLVWVDPVSLCFVGKVHKYLDMPSVFHVERKDLIVELGLKFDTCWLTMASNILRTSKQANVEVAQAERPNLQHVIWYKDAGLRKLYSLAAVICLASATTGFDRYV
jgi:hypothetical protein